MATVAGDVAMVAHTDLFEKLGFKIADSKDAYKLLAFTFTDQQPLPALKKVKMKGYDGLHMLYAYQCPLNSKYLKDITAYCEANGINLNTRLIASEKEAQNCPNPLGVYALIYNNKVVADHPVSLGRFKNIVHKELGL